MKKLRVKRKSVSSDDKVSNQNPQPTDVRLVSESSGGSLGELAVPNEEANPNLIVTGQRKRVRRTIASRNGTSTSESNAAMIHALIPISNSAADVDSDSSNDSNGGRFTHCMKL